MISTEFIMIIPFFLVLFIFFFQECTVFLCDFHREQAWERWLVKASNGMAPLKEEALMMMRQIAQSPTEAVYDSRVKVLKTSEVWNRQESGKFKDWFENTWLSEKKVCKFTLIILIFVVTF